MTVWLRLWRLDTEHPTIVFLGFDLTLRNQLEKSFVRWPVFPLGLLQRYDIVMPQHRRDGYDTITLVYQDQVHQQPGSPSVAVLERVNIHQTSVRISGKFYWVKALLPLCQLRRKVCHTLRNVFRGGRDVVGSCDEHLPFSVLPCCLRVDAIVKQVVQMPDDIL